MADEIVGVAVLEESAEPGLLVLCRREGTKDMLVRIPVRLRGTPDRTPSTLEYDLQGDMIHVTPSLKVSTRRPPEGDPDALHDKWVDVELFHNGGDWRVRVVMTTQGTGYERFVKENGSDWI